MSLQVRVVDTFAATASAESVVDLIQPIGVCGPLTETGYSDRQLEGLKGVSTSRQVSA